LREAIRQYGGLVSLVVSRILPGLPQDVEECVADTFANIWKNLGQLDENVNLKGYLLCTARNTAINRYNQIKRRKSVPFELLELASEDDVELAAIDGETMEALQRLITGLNEPDREIIIRKYFLFESLAVIGGHLGLSAEQVKKRLYRCRQNLKEALKERGITHEAI
jgi:RNA polymerase sigma-70 factor (ECF subfamily)